MLTHAHTTIVSPITTHNAHCSVCAKHRTTDINSNSANSSMRIQLPKHKQLLRASIRGQYLQLLHLISWFQAAPSFWYPTASFRSSARAHKPTRQAHTLISASIHVIDPDNKCTGGRSSSADKSDGGPLSSESLKPWALKENKQESTLSPLHSPAAVPLSAGLSDLRPRQTA